MHRERKIMSSEGGTAAAPPIDAANISTSGAAATSTGASSTTNVGSSSTVGVKRKAESSLEETRAASSTATSSTSSHSTTASNGTTDGTIEKLKRKLSNTHPTSDVRLSDSEHKRLLEHFEKRLLNSFKQYQDVVSVVHGVHPKVLWYRTSLYSSLQKAKLQRKQTQQKENQAAKKAAEAKQGAAASVPKPSPSASSSAGHGGSFIQSVLQSANTVNSRTERVQQQSRCL